MSEHFPSIRKVPLQCNGALYVMPKPDSHRIDETLNHLMGLGVGHIICFMEDDELEMLGLSREPIVADQMGMRFTQYEIVDFGLPGDPAHYREFVKETTTAIKAGASVAVHCHAGIGRTGTFAACILMELGFAAEEAMAHLSEARGRRAPQTEAQRQFVRDFKTH